MSSSADDSAVLGLRVLARLVGDCDLAERFLALSGLDAAMLRQRAAEPSLLAAAIAFLAGNERDLTAVAADLDVPPAAIVAAGASLEAM